MTVISPNLISPALAQCEIALITAQAQKDYLLSNPQLNTTGTVAALSSVIAEARYFGTALTARTNSNSIARETTLRIRQYKAQGNQHAVTFLDELMETLLAE